MLRSQSLTKVDAGFIEDEAWLSNLAGQPDSSNPFRQSSPPPADRQPVFFERPISKKFSATLASKQTQPTQLSTKSRDDNEGDFIKTTFRRSEQSFDQATRWRDQLQESNRGSFDQEQLAEVAEESVSQQATLPRASPSLSFHKNRPSVVENNKMLMYENYLEQVLADKPGKIQSLLLQKYYGNKPQPPEDPFVTNRITNAMRQLQRAGSFSSQETRLAQPSSFILQNLQSEVDNRLANPQPVLLTEQGVKMITDKHGRQVPLKLVKFIKETHHAGKDSINYPSRDQATNLVYLTDKYQMNNLIKNTQPPPKPKPGSKDYSKLKTESLWPKGTKLRKPALNKSFEANELSRLSRELDSVQHSLNYAAPKHHPRNLNVQTEVKLQQKLSSVNPRSPAPASPANHSPLPVSKASTSDASRIKELIKKALGSPDQD